MYFSQSLVDVTRIRLTFVRVLADTALQAQVEILGCAKGKQEMNKNEV